MSFGEYTLLSFSSLFVIVDPIAAIPAFLAMTSRYTIKERQRTAQLACSVAALVLLVFSLLGKWIFRLLGISLPAFQIAGSLVMLLIALDMLRARRSSVKETEEETQAAVSKEDIGITPMGVPMLAGPGALSTAIVLESQAKSIWHHTLLITNILLVCALSYAIFHLASHSARWMSPIAMKIITRVMGLLLAAVAVQFMVNAVHQLITS